MTGQPVFLKVYHSEKLVTSRQFLSDQISIGSSADGPSLVLADPSVCFWHALIERRGDKYCISDLGSPTGTFVNSKQVLESPLKHGDKIQVGDFTIHFFINVPFLKADLQNVKPAKGKKSDKPVRSATSRKKQKPQPQVTSTPPSIPPGLVPKPKPKIEPEPEPRIELELEPESISPTTASEPQSQTPRPPADLKKAPSISKTTSERVSSEIQPSQEVQLEDLNVPTEFVINPLSKIKKKKNSDIKTEETGVSTLKQTEVIPPSADSFKQSSATQQPSTEQPSASYPTISSVYETDATGPSDKKEDTLPVESLNEPPNFHGTYAPPSEIQDLDHNIPTGSGPVVEVVVSWKERVLSVHHFFREDNKDVVFGSDSKADVFCPNLIGQVSYKLLKTGQQTVVYLSNGVKASVIDHKGNKHTFSKLVEKGLVTTHGSLQALPLNQSQLVRLDFSSVLRVYVRYANRSQKALASGFFDFNFSEMMGLMMSFFFMSMLFFYLALFSPQFLDPDEDLEEEGIKKATIEFNKKPKKRLVKLKVAKEKRKTKLSIPHKEKVPKKRKKVGIKKQGAEGRLGQVAAKPKEKSKKKTITSARPGGSVTTGKSGAGPKSPRPDPTKIGLLGVFGKKGTKKELDKAYSGTGELAGLAEQATGHAGQKESYTGEGIGTKFKNTGAGGKGSALIGVSTGIKTKGRGGGGRGYGRGGSLGQRGVVQLQLGTSDWEVEGGIDKNAILRVIRRNKHQLERCYEFALQKKPDLEGKVLVQWNIVNERVRQVKVRRNTTRNSVLARCLMDRLKNFRFTGTGLQKGQIGEVSIPFVVTKK